MSRMGYGEGAVCTRTEYFTIVRCQTGITSGLAANLTAAHAGTKFQADNGSSNRQGISRHLRLHEQVTEKRPRQLSYP